MRLFALYVRVIILTEINIVSEVLKYFDHVYHYLYLNLIVRVILIKKFSFATHYFCNRLVEYTSVYTLKNEHAAQWSHVSITDVEFNSPEIRGLAKSCIRPRFGIENTSPTVNKLSPRETPHNATRKEFQHECVYVHVLNFTNVWHRFVIFSPACGSMNLPCFGRKSITN